MSNLNLSKFKKICSDKNCTTLQHADGHELKIAHGRLSPKLKEQLDSLQSHGNGIKKMKYGGDSGSADDDSDDDSSPQQQHAPVTINIGGPQGQQQMPVTGNSPQGIPNALMPYPGQNQSAPTVAPKQQPQASNADDSDDSDDGTPMPQAGASPMDTNGMQTAQASGASPMDMNGMQTANGQIPSDAQNPLATGSPYSEHRQDLDEQTNQYAKELAVGHIKPETYGDLFNKKSTLGKISSIFGLLLGGLGSGLTHQPNAALAMMDREISNDLEGQKTSATNAQNFLRINQQSELNKSMIGRNEAEAKGALAEANTKAFALSQNQMLLSTYHNQAQMVDNMPESTPEQIAKKNQAKQMLGVMYSKIGEKINNINDAAAGAAGLLTIGKQAGSSTEQDFQQQQQTRRFLGSQGEMMAKDAESKHFPGIKGQASNALDADDRKELSSGIDFDQKLRRFMEFTKNHSGDLSPSDRHQGQAMAAELQGAYRQATHGGVYKEGEQNFISKIIDSDPTKFFNSIRVMPQLEAVAKENQSRINTKAKNLGFEGYNPNNDSGTSHSSTEEGSTIVNKKTGERMVKQNGKWVKQ